MNDIQRLQEEWWGKQATLWEQRVHFFVDRGYRDEWQLEVAWVAPADLVHADAHLQAVQKEVSSKLHDMERRFDPEEITDWAGTGGHRSRIPHEHKAKKGVVRYHRILKIEWGEGNPNESNGKPEAYLKSKGWIEERRPIVGKEIRS